MTNFSLNPFASQPIDAKRAVDEALNILRFTATSSAVEDYLMGRSLFVAATEVNSDHIFELNPNKTWLAAIKRTHDLKSATSEFEFVIERDEFGPAEIQPIIYDADMLPPNPRVFIKPLPDSDSSSRWGSVLDTNYLAHPFWPAVNATADSLADAAWITAMAIGSRGAYSNPVASTQTARMRRGQTLAVMPNGTEVLASLETRGVAKFDHPVPVVSTTIANAKVLPVQTPSANSAPTFSAAVYGNPMTANPQTSITAPSPNLPILMMPNLFSYGVMPSDTEEPPLNWDAIQPLPIKTDPTDGAAMFAASAVVVGSPQSTAPAKKEALQMAGDKDDAPPIAPAAEDMRRTLQGMAEIDNLSSSLEFVNATPQIADVTENGILKTKSGITFALAKGHEVTSYAANSSAEADDAVLTITPYNRPVIITLPSGLSLTLTDDTPLGIPVTLRQDEGVSGQLAANVVFTTLAGPLLIPEHTNITAYPDGRVEIGALPENLYYRQTAGGFVAIHPRDAFMQMRRGEELVVISNGVVDVSRDEDEPQMVEEPVLIVYENRAFSGRLWEDYRGTPANTPVMIASTTLSVLSSLAETDFAPPEAVLQDSMRSALYANAVIATVSNALKFEPAQQNGLSLEAHTLSAGSITTAGGIQLSIAANTMVINIAADPKQSGKDMALHFITDSPVLATLANGQSFSLVEGAGMEVTVYANGTVSGYLQDTIEIPSVVGMIALPAKRFVTIHPDGQIDLDTLTADLELHISNPLSPIRDVLIIAKKPDVFLSLGEDEPTDEVYNTHDLVIYPNGILEGNAGYKFRQIAAGTRVYAIDAETVIPVPNAHFD